MDVLHSMRLNPCLSQAPSYSCFKLGPKTPLTNADCHISCWRVICALEFKRTLYLLFQNKFLMQIFPGKSAINLNQACSPLPPFISAVQVYQNEWLCYKEYGAKLCLVHFQRRQRDKTLHWI